MPGGRNAPTDWPADPVSLMWMGSAGRPPAPHRRGRARTTVPAGHLGAEQGADGAVDVAHGQFEPHRMRVLESAFGELDQRAVQRLIQAVVLTSYASSLCQLPAMRVGGHGEHRTQVEAPALPVGD